MVRKSAEPQPWTTNQRTPNEKERSRKVEVKKARHHEVKVISRERNRIRDATWNKNVRRPKVEIKIPCAVVALPE